MSAKKNEVSGTEENKTNNIKKETKAPGKKEEGNFLVLSCAGENIGSGTKLTIVNVAKTPESAVNYIKGLTGSRPEYMCVVEKKSLYSRRPQIVVTEIK